MWYIICIEETPFVRQQNVHIFLVLCTVEIDLVNINLVEIVDLVKISPLLKLLALA